MAGCLVPNGQLSGAGPLMYELKLKREPGVRWSAWFGGPSASCRDKP